MNENFAIDDGFGNGGAVALVLTNTLLIVSPIILLLITGSLLSILKHLLD